MQWVPGDGGRGRDPLDGVRVARSGDDGALTTWAYDSLWTMWVQIRLCLLGERAFGEPWSSECGGLERRVRL